MCKLAPEIPGVLVTWAGVKLSNNKAFNHPVLILNKDDYLKFVKNLFI